MNEWDSNNLRFILSLKTDGDWDKWAATCSLDDIDYAIQLVRTSIAEVMVEQMKVEEACQQEDGIDCSQALEIINRVKKESL
jgi:uncharacterized protein YpbB